MCRPFPCPSREPSPVKEGQCCRPPPGCSAETTSPCEVTAQRGTKLQPLLFDPLRQDWLPRSPPLGAHLRTHACAWLPVPGVRERLCSRIPYRPGLVQRQPSPGMTWIHFKSAVTHPGLAPGLSTHLPRCCLPRSPSPAGTAGCWGSQTLSPCPPYCAAHSARASAVHSPYCASLAWSLMGPCRLFPAADEVVLESRSNAPTAVPAQPAPRWLPMPQPGSGHSSSASPRCKSHGRAQENWHSSQGWPLASPLTQGLYTNSMSWKHGVAP